MTKRLKFVAYNCHLFDGIIGPVPKWNDAARRDRIAEQIDSGDFDIVGLSEVWSDANKELFIRRCQRSLPHSFTDFPSVGMGSGLVLLSRYPLLAPRFTRFSALAGLDSMSQKGILQAVVVAKAGMFRVFLTHTQADDRVAELLHRVGHGVKKAAELLLRRFWKGWPKKRRASESAMAYPLSTAVRAANMLELREQIHSYYSDLPAVVFGDLNVPDISPEYAAMMQHSFAGFLDTYPHLHPGKKAATYEPDNPLVKRWDSDPQQPSRLDYILCSANGAWSVAESAPLIFKMPNGEDLSDHYGMGGCLTLEQSHTVKDPLVFSSRVEARGMLKKLKDAHGRKRAALIVIHNNTELPLVSAGAHSSHRGRFFDHYPAHIPPRHLGVLLHTGPGYASAFGGGGIVEYQTPAADVLFGWQFSGHGLPKSDNWVGVHVGKRDAWSNLDRGELLRLCKSGDPHPDFVVERLSDG